MWHRHEIQLRLDTGGIVTHVLIDDDKLQRVDTGYESGVDLQSVGSHERKLTGSDFETRALVVDLYVNELVVYGDLHHELNRGGIKASEIKARAIGITSRQIISGGIRFGTDPTAGIAIWEPDRVSLCGERLDRSGCTRFDDGPVRIDSAFGKQYAVGVGAG